MLCMTAVSWLMAVAFAGIVLLVVVVSYAVLYWVFRNQGGPDS
jgi:cbb3-type cytochrome oxidase subunit 3